jgi:multidrug transporter EmrE-like cation transporter
MKPVLSLLIAVVLATIGQIFLKKGVLVTGEVTVTLKGDLIKELFNLLFNPFVFLGLVLYMISTILWLSALSKTTLNFVYPFTALTFVLVMLSSRVIFLESAPMMRYVGIGLICVGFLISSMA